MPEPEYVLRSYGGGAVPAQLVQPLGAADLSFTITPTTGWVEENGSPLGTSGPFTIAIDRFTPSVEKILCSSVNLTTGLISVYVSGDGWNGRGYDGTAGIAHVPNGSTSGVQNVWSSQEAKEANQAVYDILGGGSSSLIGVPIGTSVDFRGTPLTLPANFMWENATAVSRSTYSALFTAITIAATGDTTLSGTTITNVSSTITPYLAAGMQITGANLGTLGTIFTIASVTSTTIVLSGGGTGIIAGTGGALVIYPHGAGDGHTTFNLPDSRGRVTAGAGAVGTTAQPTLYTGQTGGVTQVTVSSTYLPTTAPWSIVDPGHAHHMGANVYLNNVASTIGPVSAGGLGTTSGLYSDQLTTSVATGITLGSNSGGGTALPISNPYSVATKIIRVS